MPASQTEQAYTVSKLQMYDECPQKYKFCYIDKVHVVERIDVSDASRKGNNLHNTINYYLKGQDVSNIIKEFTSVEKELWVNFKNSEVLNYHFMKSEYAFNVNINGYWFTGRIDALFRDLQKDEFIIMDWKTGENFNGENTSFQTAFYLLCLHEILKSVNYIQKPNQLSMHYFNLATDSIVKIKLVNDLLRQYQTKIFGIVDKINTDKVFAGYKTDKCKMCKYRGVCPY